MRIRVRKLHGNLVFTIPIVAAEALGLMTGTRFELCARGTSVVLQKIGPPRRRMAEIVKQINPAVYRRQSKRSLMLARAVAK